MAIGVRTTSVPPLVSVSGKPGVEATRIQDDLLHLDNDNNNSNDGADDQGDDQGCGYGVEALGGGSVVLGPIHVPDHLPVSGLLRRDT